MTLVLVVRHGLTATTGVALTGWTPGISLDDRGRAQAAALGARLAGLPLDAIITSPLERCVETAEAIASARHPASVHGAASTSGTASSQVPPNGQEPAHGQERADGQQRADGQERAHGQERADGQDQADRQELAVDGPVVTPQEDARLGECRYGDWTGQPLKRLAADPLWRVVQAHPSAVRFPGEDGESMLDMQNRAVDAVRDWNRRLGHNATYLICSHGDVIKAILADSLGLHLDMCQRIQVDPCSLSVIRYTPLRPFLLRMNDTGGDVAGLRKPPGQRPKAAARGEADAQVGGGAGG
jgi:probable phosphomutase (TIGR03848 family)